MGRRTDLDGLEAGPTPLGWTAGPSVLLVLLGGVTWPPTLIASGRDERMQRIANERVEREVVPAVRSMNGLIATPTGRLVSQLKTPARFVIPGASSQVPDWLEARAAAEPGLVKVDSTPGIANPERSSELAVAAVRGDPLPAVTVNPDSYGARSARKDPISAKLGGLNARLLLRGLLQVLLGLPLLLWPGPFPTELVTATLVVWLGIEGTQTLVGAIGLKRRGQGWLVWAAVGMVGILFAVALLAGSLFAIRAVAWITLIGAGLRGMALLIVAMKASRTPGATLGHGLGRTVLAGDRHRAADLAAAGRPTPAIRGGRLSDRVQQQQCGVRLR